MKEETVDAPNPRYQIIELDHEDCDSIADFENGGYIFCRERTTYIWDRIRIDREWLLTRWPIDEGFIERGYTRSRPSNAKIRRGLLSVAQNHWPKKFGPMSRDEATLIVKAIDGGATRDQISNARKKTGEKLNWPIAKRGRRKSDETIERNRIIDECVQKIEADKLTN